MTELDFAMRFLGEYTVRGGEIIPLYCPYCKGGARHDKRTFALSMENHTYNCKRGSCDQSGHFSQLCKDFGVECESENERFHVPKVKRNYKKPKTKAAPATKAAMAYIKRRGITQKTAESFNIQQDRSGNMVFPFYRSKEDFELDRATFIKFRKPRKLKKGERKMWREADTEPILFGMHLCSGEGTLYLFEGEFDAMCGQQVLGENCVSVPSGVSDYTWIETCYDWLEPYERIVIMADNDDPGKTMLNELSVKLGGKIMRPDFENYLECKDVNEILLLHGEAALKKALEEVHVVEVQGILNLADVQNVDIDTLPRVMSGIPQLDRATGGMFMGDLSVWTGKRGEGKSTILTQLLLDAVHQGHKVCAYSGEMPADRLKYIVNLQAAGDDYTEERADTRSDRAIQFVPRKYLDAIEDWYNGQFWIYDNKIVEDDEAGNIINTFELAYKRYNCRVFLVDNLMTVSSCRDDRDYYQMQADFTIKLRKLAEKISSHIHLVVHPRKGEIKDSDSVSGLSTITNIACNVFSMRRVDKQEEGCSAVITCLKNRMFGENAAVRLDFSLKSRRYTQLDNLPTMYNWKDGGVQLSGLDEYEGETPFGGTA